MRLRSTESKDNDSINQTYDMLMKLPPVDFLAYAKHWEEAGTVTDWREHENPQARLLALACDVANENEKTATSFIEYAQKIDISTFESFDRVAYLLSAVLPYRVDRPEADHFRPKYISDIIDTPSLKKMFDHMGDQAKVFWSTRENEIFLHTARHLNEPYRLYQLAHWVNYRTTMRKSWCEFGAFGDSEFSHKVTNPLLKMLLADNLIYAQKNKFSDIIETNGRDYPILESLSETQRSHVLKSIAATIAAKSSSDEEFQNSEAYRQKLPSNPPSSEVLYKNFSGMDFEAMDLSDLDLSGSNFTNAGLCQTSFKNATLISCNFENVTYHSKHAHTAHRGPKNPSANFTDCNLSKSIMRGTIEENTTFNNATLDKLDMRHTILKNISLIDPAKQSTGVYLTGAAFLDNIESASSYIDLSGLNTHHMKIRHSDHENRIFDYFEPEQLFCHADRLTELTKRFFKYQTTKNKFYLLLNLYLNAGKHHAGFHQYLTTILNLAPEDSNHQTYLGRLNAFKDSFELSAETPYCNDSTQAQKHGSADNSNVAPATNQATSQLYTFFHTTISKQVEDVKEFLRDLTSHRRA